MKKKVWIGWVLLFILRIIIPAQSAIAQISMTYMPKFSSTALKEDAILLKKILEANHPSLYWYSSKESLDSGFNSLMLSLNDSLNEIQFKNRVAGWIAQIKCGHTSTLFSKSFLKNPNQFRYPRFPLQIKFWEDSAVVLNNGYTKDSIIKRGTIIEQINGLPMSWYRNHLFQQISNDGNATNHSYQVISNGFPDLYKQVFGVDSSYLIGFIDGKGKSDTASLGNFTPVTRDSLSGKALPPANNRIPPTGPTFSKRQIRLLSIRSLSIDTTTHSAYVRLTSFSKGGLKKFFRRSFKKLKKENIQHLIIDLRENGGGKISNSIDLTRYLSNKPFKVADSVVATNRKLTYGKYIQHSWMYWLAMNLGAHKATDGSIHYRRFEQHYFQPYTKNKFSGQVYLVQGGYTFSATTMVVGALKGQENIKVVGEESGGGYYGNSAMHIPNITLPNSKLRVRLPLYRMVINSNRPKGRGIVPDIKIPPSSAAIREGWDPKMAAILQMIQSKNN
ncbi:S41 family peptidase [Sediminibacterium sp. TEGAF015]|uniref:S41 family peptidase n=1 Tax=Sediminibacterium sp. TEGAF015 TaxID=575378 RepID=UPI0021FE927A|nr:S41 family peptidase [Sediminibacterium sp. TEGAF015]BDQ12849.1 hypothetical protein TEGAF0_20660 [Sediminibacterium sp. TEGAF015]